MVANDPRATQRRIHAILRVLANESRPMGSRLIAKQLEKQGLALSERGVRYHLLFTDEKGLTQLDSSNTGRVITALGIQELESSLVEDKVGREIARIEALAYRSTFDPESGKGLVPVNITLMPEDSFSQAIRPITDTVVAGVCAADSARIARPGKRIGNMVVPQGKVAFCSVSSIVIDGYLLGAGIPMTPRFGGLLLVRDHTPVRFVELVEYARTSINPSEVFMRGRLTDVGAAIAGGEGRILANFREMPSACLDTAKSLVNKLSKWGIRGFYALGQEGEPLCGIQVRRGMVGVIITGGLNPIARASELGFSYTDYPFGDVLRYESMYRLSDKTAGFEDRHDAGSNAIAIQL